ncbi:hypothetical protein DHEL01_v201835 [Diaporthe helianthi]|uniref:Uncharacterized protein n=1 Tax=Diaporthe helianthi TaxID=158607 RepID=A0A2P5IB90_DIAHE|nr:hypothetical protein DHEL01_v201835 [Diaporthe helianthi]
MTFGRGPSQSSSSGPLLPRHPHWAPMWIFTENVAFVFLSEKILLAYRTILPVVNAGGRGRDEGAEALSTVSGRPGPATWGQPRRVNSRRATDAPTRPWRVEIDPSDLAELCQPVVRVWIATTILAKCLPIHTRDITRARLRAGSSMWSTPGRKDSGYLPTLVLIQRAQAWLLFHSLGSCDLRPDSIAFLFNEYP